MILINESERGKANSAMSFIFHHHTYLTFQKDDDFSFKQLVIILSLDSSHEYSLFEGIFHSRHANGFLLDLSEYLLKNSGIIFGVKHFGHFLKVQVLHF